MSKLKRKLKAHFAKTLNSLHAPYVKSSLNDPYHQVFEDFKVLTQQKENPSILEIGSRDVSDLTRRDIFPHCTDYTGFDVREGGGVDVVGDAHKLGSVFPDKKFDFVYSVSVFEHLLFPWKVVLETNKVMNTGGYVFVSTHPVWPEHEQPWDFWRFPVNGLRVLFNQFTGFEVITATEGIPGRCYSLSEDAPTREMWKYNVNLGVAIIAKKIGDYDSDLLKWDIDITDVVDTMYPPKRET